jgi:hypothetical protein
VRTRGGGLGDAEALCERYPAGDRRTRLPASRDDLSLDDPRGLEIPGDTGQVIKIIWHVVSLASLARLVAKIDSLARLDDLAR